MTDIQKDVSQVSPCPDELQSLVATGFEDSQGEDTEEKARVPRVPKERERPYYECHKTDGAWGPAGVYYYAREKENGEVPPPQWLCSPLEVTARTRDTDSEEWGRLLEWHDPDGMAKLWGMPENLLMGDAPAVLGPLAAGGLEIAYHAKKGVMSYIASRKPWQRAFCVAKTGWAAPSVYVAPCQVVNEADGDRYIFQSETRPEPRQVNGTLESWRSEVAALCVGNSRLMFAVSTAFAGPLLEPCGFSGGGFHFQGSSSIGKSLSMVMAASVMDHPEKAVITWRTTDNGLEGIAARHNDGLLMLDELGQVDGRKAGEIAYMLSNGTGKARANKEGAARRRMTWRLVFLSNGEIDLASHMAESGKRTMAGQEVRMVTIPADAGQGLGIFEHLHGEVDGKAMADRVKAVAFTHYGTAFMPFVRYVAEEWDSIAKQGRDLVKAFVQEVAPAGADGQVLRAAERFGLVAMAGDLATKAGITGWPDGAAIQAAAACFDAWLVRRGGHGSHEEAEIIRRVVETLTKDASRFESIEQAESAEQTRVSERLGFVSGGRYLLPVPGFRDMLKGFDSNLAAEVLHARGIIRHEIGRKLPRIPLPGLGRQRCYAIEAEHLPDID